MGNGDGLYKCKGYKYTLRKAIHKQLAGKGQNQPNITPGKLAIESPQPGFCSRRQATQNNQHQHQKQQKPTPTGPLAKLGCYRQILQSLRVHFTPFISISISICFSTSYTVSIIARQCSTMQWRRGGSYDIGIALSPPIVHLQEVLDLWRALK